MFERLIDDCHAVVVIVHGAFEHSGRYEWLINRLNQHNISVVFGDLPGQGVSKGEKGYIDRFEQYFDTVLKWVERGKQFNRPLFLFGHSMGGLITIRMMQIYKFDVQGVILSSPALGIANGLSKPLFYLSKILNKTFPTMQFPTGIESQMSTRNKDFHVRDEADPLFLRKVSVRWYHEFEKAIIDAHQDINEYPDIPTLLMQSGKDRLILPQDVKKWFDSLPIKNKTFKLWEELYHELLNEPEREDVFKDVIEFIGKQIKK